MYRRTAAASSGGSGGSGGCVYIVVSPIPESWIWVLFGSTIEVDLCFRVGTSLFS